MRTRPLIDDRKNKRPTVIVIDDDRSVRDALKGLFESVGLSAETHGSVREFIAADDPEKAGCIVLDIRLPGQSGLEFQEELARSSVRRSIVLISAHVDVPMAVRAMKAGAIDVLSKPVREQDLLEAVNRSSSRGKHSESCHYVEIPDTDATRATDHDVGDRRQAEQADRSRTATSGADGEASQRPYDAEDEGDIRRSSRQDCR
jgi:FixJ family two-component response regulator